MQECNNAEELANNVKREAEGAERKHNKEVNIDVTSHTFTSLRKYIAIVAVFTCKTFKRFYSVYSLTVFVPETYSFRSLRTLALVL